jgi:membrane protein DedA with SNARE-associated domain
MIDRLITATGPVAYLLVLVAAIVEGEVVFVVAATLVSQGRLEAVGVIVAGALGGSIGDQFYFYALRGRLRRWLDRFPAIARRGHALVRRVRQHETATVLAIRFSPGLRIALSAACAYADVPALKFSLLNGLASLLWATALLALIAWAGPAWLPRLGLSGWWAAVVPAIVVIVVVRWVAVAEKRSLPRT